jgi:hypothetical protein
MMKKDGEVTNGIMKTTTCPEGHIENKELRRKRESIRISVGLVTNIFLFYNIDG